MEKRQKPLYRRSGFLAFLATSFLGAFNDNFFKLIVTCFAISRLSKSELNTYVPLTGAMFVLPYLLCSSYAGYLADRFAKRRLLIWTKWLELLVMLFGLWLFHCNAVYTLLAALFLMGAQSAFYSPAKYGYIPETMEECDLPNGNGLTQLCTFIAIIVGSWAGGVISRIHSSNWTLGAFYCVLAAVFGIGTSYFTDKTPIGSAKAHFQLNPLQTHITTLRTIKKNRLLLLSMLCNSFFWYIAALFQNNLSLLVKQALGGSEQVLGALLGAVGLGIGLGCLVSGLLSRRRIEYGLILPGGIFTAFSAILMGTLGRYLPAAFLFSATLGFFAGIYQLPLSTSVQKHSPASKRGSCLALGNAMDCIGMLLAYFTQWILLNLFKLTPGGVFVALGTITLLVLLYIAFKVPAFPRKSRELLFKSAN